MQANPSQTASRGRAASPAPLPAIFVAIDFETADEQPDSACAVGAVRVEHGEITERVYKLIRPPRSRVAHAFIHGLSWSRLRSERPFAAVWPEVAPLFEGAERIVAHNARFDRSVLFACCAAAGLTPPPLAWECTVELARRTFRLPSARLPAVAEHLGIALEHHHALSDAEACARILVAARAAERMRFVGVDPSTT